MEVRNLMIGEIVRPCIDLIFWELFLVLESLLDMGILCRRINERLGWEDGAKDTSSGLTHVVF